MLTEEQLKEIENILLKGKRINLVAAAGLRLIRDIRVLRRALEKTMRMAFERHCEYPGIKLQREINEIVKQAEEEINVK